MGGFVMVPAWFRRKKPSAAAMLTYVTLAGFGRFDTETAVYEECRPSVATLAEACGMAQATVKRALVELYGLGAVERRQVIESGKGQRPSVYRVIFGSVEGPEPGLVIPAEVTGGTDMSQRGGSDLSHRVTSENADLSHRSEAHTGGSNPGSSNLTHEEELNPSTHNHKEEKINTTALARVTDERDPLTSPAFMLDTATSRDVWSGQTATVGDIAKAHYRQTEIITEEIMSNYVEWMLREAGEVVTDVERRDIGKVVNGLINDRPRGLSGDALRKFRNGVAAGLGQWSISDSWSVKQIPGFVLRAKRGSLPKEEKPSAGAQNMQQVARNVAALAGKTAEDVDDMLEAMLRKSHAAGFGGGAAIRAISGGLA
jgi:hypothetical protein